MVEGNGVLINYKSAGCLLRLMDSKIQTIISLNVPLKKEKATVFGSICLNHVIWFTQNLESCFTRGKFSVAGE